MKQLTIILLATLVLFTQVAWSAMDPPTTPEPVAVSYAEVIAFLNADHTNWNVYETRRDHTRYVCLHFSCDVQRAAREQGIKCAFVWVFLNAPVSHAIVAFETTDKGIVFFEPQNDHRMKVEVGRKYWSWISPANYHLEYDDTVTDLVFYWDYMDVCAHWHGGR